MKFTPAISTLWASAPSGAKTAPPVSGGTSRPMRTRKIKKSSSSVKKSLDKAQNLCYNKDTKGKGKPTKPAD